MAGEKIITGNLDRYFEASRKGENIDVSKDDMVVVGDNRNQNLKEAQFSESSSFATSRVMMTSPQFYSPVHTPTNWQIPSKRREVYLWCVTPDTYITILRDDFITQIPICQVNILTDLALTHNGVFKRIKVLYERNIDEDIYYLYTGLGNTKQPLKITGNHKIFYLEREKVICDYQIKRKHQRRCVKIHKKHSCCSTSPTCYARKEINLKTNLIEAENLKIKDYVYDPVYKNINIDEKINSIEMARFLGYYLAEGCSGKYCFDFTLNINEQDTFGKEIIEYSEKLFGLKPRIIIKNNTLRIYFCSKNVCNFIKHYIPGKAIIKKVHKNIIDMDREWLLNFIGAYFNGDGTYSKNTQIGSSTASKDLAFQIKFILNKLGIVSSDIYKAKNTLNGKTFYSYHNDIPIGQCKELSKFCDREIFEGFKHHSKSESFINENKLFKYIKKIEKHKYEGPVYCLGVDDDESFVAAGVAISNCRFFAANEPKIAASLRFYSQFPFSGFTHSMDDPIRLEYFDNLRKRLRLDHWLPLIAYEYFAMGDAFPFASFACSDCKGVGTLSTGEQCQHKGGTISKISILNPDWVEVRLNPMDPDNPSISLVPDDTLKQIVFSKKPPEIFESIPLHFRKMIVENKPIPLSKRSVTHLKHDEVAYQPYGRSVIASLFPTLAYQDKLRQAQWIVAERHILPIKVVKVGNDQKPASQADIMDVQRQLGVTANDPNLALVTHHAFCHDDQTEVLVKKNKIKNEENLPPLFLSDDGVWKHYKDVEDDDEIMIFDKEKNIMLYDNFSKRFEYDYDGDMIHFYKENERGFSGVDIKVTPNHKMLTRKHDSRNWEVLEAKDIKSGYCFKLSGLRLDEENIKIEKYKGKVWCFETKTGFFITRRNGKTTIQGNSYDFVGASGKVLQLTKEWDLIDKAIIQGLGVNEALLSGCIPEYSRLLTNDGFKNLNEFDKKKHLVATLNPKTHKFEWLKAKDVISYEYDSIDGKDERLVHFKTSRKIDNIFTPNHEMFVKQKLGRKLSDKYEKIRADKVKDRSRFILKTEGWDGIVPNNVKDLTMGIDLELFLKLSGYYISEGSFLKYYDKRKYNTDYSSYNTTCPINKRIRASREKTGISMAQSVDSDVIADFFELKDKLLIFGFNMYHTRYMEKNKSDWYSFRISNKEMGQKFNDYFGEYAEGKKIPKWIKDLPEKYLNIFISSAVEGDGSERIFSYESGKSTKNYSYSSTSKKLIEDMFEILIKTRMAPIISKIDNSNKENRHDLYSLYWSPETVHGDYPYITSQRGNKAIRRIDYKGKVWCVNVPPNHLILCENNGNTIWTGNSGPSYSQAAIGIEATIRRLNIVRVLMAEWIEEKLYKPEARMQGFYTEDLQGNKILHYPKIKWDDLNLRDESQKNQMYLQLWDKGIVSTQFICEKMEIDYDIETERVRLEQQYQQQMGISPQPGPGGLGGGLKRPPKPMGGGFGGGPKGPGVVGGDEMKGNLPGGKSGPGLPGDEFAPSMSGGETVGAKSKDKIVTGQFSEEKSRDIEFAKNYVPTVRNPGKFKLQDLNDAGKVQPWNMQEEEEPEPFEFYEGPRTGAFRPNNLELALYAAIAEVQANNNLPSDFIYQEKPEPNRMPRVTVDGMWPSLKLIVEADGGIFHSGPEQIQNNEQRDMELASYGWTILRYTDDQIKREMPMVIKNIIETANKIKEKLNETHEE